MEEGPNLMPPTATKMEDKERNRYSKLSRRYNGATGERHYLVDTHDADMALFATGLPIIGESWSGAFPNLQCVEIEPDYEGGSDWPATGTGGTTFVVARYVTPELYGRIPIPGETWTEVVWNVAQQQTLFAIATDPAGDEKLPLLNGDGFPVDYGYMEARVYAYRSLQNPPDFARINSAVTRQLVNHDTILLPRVHGSSQTWALPRGTVRYHGVEMDGIATNEGDTMFEVVHTLLIAENPPVPFPTPPLFEPGKAHWLRWEKAGPDGRQMPTPEYIYSQVYPFGDLAGLW